MKHLSKFNESIGRSTAKYGDGPDDYEPPSESDSADLLKLIEDRIKNNVEIKEFTDKEPLLDIQECMKIIKADLKHYSIKRNA